MSIDVILPRGSRYEARQSSRTRSRGRRSSGRATDLIAVSRGASAHVRRRHLTRRRNCSIPDRIESTRSCSRGRRHARLHAGGRPDVPGMTADPCGSWRDRATRSCAARAVNPRGDSGDQDASFLEGLTCMIFDFRDGRVVACATTTSRHRVTARNSPTCPTASRRHRSSTAGGAAARGHARRSRHPAGRAVRVGLRELAQLVGADFVDLGGTATTAWRQRRRLEHGRQTGADRHPRAVEGESVTARVYRTTTLPTSTTTARPPEGSRRCCGRSVSAPRWRSSRSSSRAIVGGDRSSNSRTEALPARPRSG